MLERGAERHFTEICLYFGDFKWLLFFFVMKLIHENGDILGSRRSKQIRALQSVFNGVELPT